MNAQVQGPMFHCLLWCVIRLMSELKKSGMRAVVVNNIYDCVLADVPREETQDYLNLAFRVMTKDIMKAWDWLIVPLAAEAEVTPVNGGWQSKEPWIETHGVWGPTT